MGKLAMCVWERSTVQALVSFGCHKFILQNG